MLSVQAPCKVEDIIDDVLVEIIGVRGGVVDVTEKPKLAAKGVDELSMPTRSSWDARAPGQSSHRSCC
jgi:hypothetical protein